MVYRGVKAPVLLHVLSVLSSWIKYVTLTHYTGTSGMSIHTKEICNQELIYAVTKSFLNASYNVYIAFCPQSGNKKLDKLDNSKNFQFQKGGVGIIKVTKHRIAY